MLRGVNASAPPPLCDAALAAVLLAVDPAALGGIWVRARVGPALDGWTAFLRACLPDETPVRRLPIHVADDRLIGGIDLAATLRSGRTVVERGLLAACDGGVLIVPMAERMTGATASRLAATLDTATVVAEREGISAVWPARLAVVAIDEGRDDDEPVPAALLDRLALAVDLAAAPDEYPGAMPDAVDRARRGLAGVRVEEREREALCAAGLALGVDSMRMAVAALRTARAHAAWVGRQTVEGADLEAAVRLVFALRATRMPAEPEEAAAQDADPPPSAPNETDQSPDHADSDPAGDRLVEVARAVLPPDLLARLAAGLAPRRPGNTAGRRGEGAASRRRGRPLGSVPGDPRRGDRLNLADTLRAAAPWQRLRGRQGAAVIVRPEDFRVVRYRHRSESVTVFVVDASGSSALHRLAEAKGAVELLLAECYVRRDQVALLAFRGEAADLLLPPTRSLVRAKRMLAGLPGGGGTPLASGLDMAAGLARAIRREGRSPSLVVLTDGRANIGRDGAPGREAASRDATDAARRIAGESLPALVLDTSPRPRPEAADLARAMAGLYLPLPQADAAAVSRAVIAARGG
ncbi:magnesium chelatase subunit D [Thalassobaculum salexigens]|uniref:magnesium chelatase subunit D n=1 Tax=Thalassobaculum salexigens TaxID=455360 RepID=UPI00248E8D29|nr:magnesium chelatase subunit D [Thalassobaculum salexigens]